jgi:hypothetical protein
MIVLIVVCMHIVLTLQIKLEKRRTTVGIYKFMVRCYGRSNLYLIIKVKGFLSDLEIPPFLKFTYFATGK